MMITLAISLDSTIAGRGVLIWFDTKMEISFIFPLAILIPIETIMFTCRTAPLLQNTHRSTGMCCLQVSLQFPIRMLLQSTRQEASNSLINCLGTTTSSNYVTTVCQLLCHFLPQLLHAAGLRHQDVESSSALIAQGKWRRVRRMALARAANLQAKREQNPSTARQRSATEKAKYAHKCATGQRLQGL
jgi:hypothetical protein